MFDKLNASWIWRVLLSTRDAASGLLDERCSRQHYYRKSKSVEDAASIGGGDVCHVWQCKVSSCCRTRCLTHENTGTTSSSVIGFYRSSSRQGIQLCLLALQVAVLSKSKVQFYNYLLYSVDELPIVIHGRTTENGWT